MSAEAPVLTHTWRIGQRTCVLTIARPIAGQAVHAVFEWTPDVPKNLSAAEWKQYRAGRDAGLAELSRKLGVRAVALEL